MTTPFRDLARRSVGRLREFRRDTRANFTMLFAFSAIPLIGLSGMALDYGSALSTKARLDSAADSAAIAATNAATSALSSNATWQTAQQAGLDRGNAVFSAGSKGASAIVTLTNTSGIVSTKVSYSTDVPTGLSKVLGIDKIAVSGSRVASQGSAFNNQYTQIVFLADISGSMAFGGTKADSDKIVKATGCAFACHDTQFVDSDKKSKGYVYVRDNLPEVKFKLDYLKAAMLVILAQVRAAGLQNDPHVVMSAYSFATKIYTHIVGSSDQSAVTSAIGGLEIEDLTAVWRLTGRKRGDTRINLALNTVATNLTNVGDGSSASFRKTYVIFVTDGIQKVNGNQDTKNYSNGCKTLKATGATLIVIQIRFPNGIADDNLKKDSNDAATTLKACASDPTRYYFESYDGPDLVSSMNSIFSGIQSGGPPKTVLTQ